MFSARQNGGAAAFGGAGFASTSLWVMRWTRQLWAPRVNVWPTVASHTNSSSNSPIKAPLSASRNLK